MDIRHCPKMSKDANGSTDTVDTRLCLMWLMTPCSTKAQRQVMNDIFRPVLSGLFHR